MEVILSPSTVIRPSSRKLDFGKVLKSGNGPQMSASVAIKMITNMDHDTMITITGKVLKVGEDVEIRAGLVKRDVVIADNTGNVVVTLWQERRNEVKMNYSYKLANASIRQYNGEKYVSVTSNCRIEEVDDVGGVDEDGVQDFSDGYCTSKELKGCTIVMVTKYSNKLVCVCCGGSVVAVSDKFGRCGKCEGKQRLDRCTRVVSVHLVVKFGDRDEQMSLNASADIFKEILDNVNINKEKDVTEAMLLAPDNINLQYRPSTNTIISLSI